MASIFIISHTLVLFHKKSAKYKKLCKAITNFVKQLQILRIEMWIEPFSMYTAIKKFEILHHVT